MKICLDSDAYSRLAKGDRSVSVTVRDADEVILSAIVVGELIAGFRNGTRFESNRSQLRTFLADRRVTFVAIGPATCDHYGIIMASLKSKGRPIPTNDVWIAAHVLETGSELVSGDRHYEAIDGIPWQRLDVM